MEAMWADPVVTRFLSTQPLSPEECWSRLLRYRGHWALMGYGYWAIEGWDTGDYVGDAGFANYRRQTEPQVEIAPEAGWVLARVHHGKGYATEAVQGILAWGRPHFGTGPLRCIIQPDHTTSLRMAAKCGFVPKRTVIYKGSPTILLDAARQPE